ncbi:DUF4302 domain-containing protein [Myroides fluvii]|uniref:DUF4302 domain-containing protein n=1 Tax=Myroides fluvii TaxID=2572594 RepID=UPI00131DC88A|nr:DUF4302 domain-containing protein [Myroides fluvii]
MKKYVIKIAALSFALVGLVSCTNIEDNDIYDKNQIQRFEETKAKLKSELVSAEHGWIVDFFPENSALGAYSLLFEFNEDGTVETRSDVTDGKYDVVKEEYDFVMLSTLALSFPVQTTVHNITAKYGSRIKTDIEFLYDETKENEILFKGHFTRNQIVFRKATAEDKQFDLTMKHRNLDLVSAKRNMVITSGEDMEVFNFRYTKNTRYAKVSNSAGNSINGNGGIGIGGSNEGIIISPAIEFPDGSSISELIFENGVFKGESGNNSVIIM